MSCWTSDELTSMLATRPVDAAVVAVRSSVVGGAGDELARGLLAAGVAVLQELPIHTREIVRSLHIARDTGTVFRPCPFYDVLAPVQHFIRRTAQVTADHPARHVLVRTCRQTLHDAMVVLSQVLPGAPPRRAEVLVGRGTALASTDWQGTPVDLAIENRLDEHNPDAMSQPLMSFVVSTDAGELELAHVHGSTSWMPMPGTGDENSANRLTGYREGTEPSFDTVTRRIWPAGMRAGVADLLDRRARGVAGMTQRELGVLYLWEDISARMGAPLFVNSARSDHDSWRSV